MAVKYTIDQENKAGSFDIYNNNILVSSFTLNVLNNTLHASALVNDVTIPLSEHINNINTIQTWMVLIQNVFNLVIVKPANNNQIYIKLPNESDGNFIISGYHFNVVYIKNTDLVTIKSRAAHTFTWGGFNTFIKFHQKFIWEVQTSY